MFQQELIRLNDLFERICPCHGVLAELETIFSFFVEFLKFLGSDCTQNSKIIQIFVDLNSENINWILVWRESCSGQNLNVARVFMSFMHKDEFYFLNMIS